MDTTPPRSGRPPGSDPLLVPPGSTSNVDRSRPGARHTASDAAARRGAQGARRRQHPARGARAVALTASVVATGAVAAGLAWSEGAWSADDDVVTDGSADQATGPLATVDGSATATSTIAPDPIPTEGGSSVTASTTEASTTTPATTQFAEPSLDASGYVDGDYLGTAEYTEWGDVQVQVTISNGAIVDVEAVSFPTGRKSSDINNQAIPMLEADAVSLQSADLDIVSGATYTSRTYADSLQAALDQAALAASLEEATS